jgi:hypothetical protein
MKEAFSERRIPSKHQKTRKTVKVVKIRGETRTRFARNETLRTRVDISFIFSI